MKRDRKNLGRRNFLKGSAFLAGAASGAGLMVKENPELEAATVEESATRSTALAACPYCGVGCGTIIQVENDKIVSMRPDKDHPTNFGLQCIKGLTAAEPIYVDRLEGDPWVRKDVWKEWKKPGHGDLEYITTSKGSFDSEHFTRVSYHDAEEMIAHKVAHLAKKYGGNSISLYGSGQLTVEGQYLENMFMKGVLGSTTIEANARMCMTSAVTAYFATLGSDTPPLAYEDIELSDMVLHFGHNPREAHPIVYWRIADHKKKNNIPTVVVDPRFTGSAEGYRDVNPNNSVHVPILNGDISFLNAMAHVILKDHPDVVDWDFMKKNTKGWKEYTDGVLKDYSPEQVQDRMGGHNHDVPPSLIRRVAGMIADATRKRNARKSGIGGVIIMWGIGYNQHIHGQHNVISIINLLSMTGNLAKPGCGPFSMTGQPNAMGERFTGGLTGRLPFNMPLKNKKHRKKMAKAWRVPEKNLVAATKAKNPGMAIGMMERGLKDEVKAMFLIYATHIDLPDQNQLVRPALSKMFVVAQEIYRHAPNNLFADVIMPAATWGEVQGVYINSERRIHVVDKAANPPPGCLPDMDMVIDKGRAIANLLGMDGDKIFPYKKQADGFYDAEEIFREIVEASKDTDADLTGMLAVEKVDGVGLYDQIRGNHREPVSRGVQWPAPTLTIARNQGSTRRYMGQEGVWDGKPYGEFRKKDGKMHFKFCKQDYSQREKITKKLMEFGVKKGLYTIDHLKLIKKARDTAMTPDIPDEEHRYKPWHKVPKDKYPYWLGLGVVYEHFHTAKSNRSPTTRRLVPEQYVEMHQKDADDMGIKDGELVKLITRRGEYQARAQVGSNSIVKPARNSVPRGYMFSPWNLSVADSADPKKTKWLVNKVSSRVWDYVSGQVDFKKLAARVEKV
jgi:anaerobic selenocysteine-containing dehydrogenase